MAALPDPDASLTLNHDDKPCLIKHPLLITVVVENILCQGDSWSFQDLRNLRLVCKLWSELTLARWRSTATLCLYLDKDKDRMGLPVSDFLEFLEEMWDCGDMLQLINKPYRRYRLKSWKIDLDGCKNSLLQLQTIWSAMGHLVHYLHLDECVFHEPVVDAFRFLVFEKSPNLKEIVFSECQRADVRKDLEAVRSLRRNEKLKSLEVTGDLPVLWSSIPPGNYLLPHFPKLQKLKISGARSHHAASDVMATWRLAARKAMKEGRELTPPFPSIHHLDYMHSNLLPITGQLSGILEMKLPLESISVFLDPDSIYPPTHLFEVFFDTLQIFKAFRPPVVHVFQNFLPSKEMKSMKEIYLWGNITQDFRFLKFMPNLEVIYMNHGCFDKWDHYLKDIIRGRAVVRHNVLTRSMMIRMVELSGFSDHLVMQRLAELSVDLEFGGDDLKKIRKWMPNLRKLTTLLNNVTFSVVCKEWFNLKELTALFGSDVDDHGITGIIEQEETEQNHSLENQRLPNITDLKYLTKFTLQAFCNEGRLTDFSVREGFLQLPFLHTLHICVSPKMSLDAEELLKESICQVRVIRNYGKRPHGGNFNECCRRHVFQMAVDSSGGGGGSAQRNSVA